MTFAEYFGLWMLIIGVMPAWVIFQDWREKRER